MQELQFLNERVDGQAGGGPGRIKAGQAGTARQRRAIGSELQFLYKTDSRHEAWIRHDRRRVQRRARPEEGQ